MAPYRIAYEDIGKFGYDSMRQRTKKDGGGGGGWSGWEMGLVEWMGLLRCSGWGGGGSGWEISLVEWMGGGGEEGWRWMVGLVGRGSHHPHTLIPRPLNLYIPRVPCFSHYYQTRNRVHSLQH